MGALRPAGRPVRVPRPGRGRARAAARRWSSGGGPRPSATRCCRSTTGRSPSWCSSGRRRCAPRARYTYWPGRAPVPESVAVNVRAPAARHHRPRHRRPTASTCSRACSRCRARCSAGGRSTSSATAGSATSTTWPAGATYRVEADVGRLAAGRPHARASGSTRPTAELLVDGEVVGAGEVKRTVVEPVLAHRRRAHRRLVTRLHPGRRGLPRPLRVHRHAAPRRHRRGRPPGGRPRGTRRRTIIASQ